MTYKFQSKDDYIAKSKLAQSSLSDFWSIIADKYSWRQKWDQVYSCDYQNANFQWFYVLFLKMGKRLSEASGSEKVD